MNIGLYNGDSLLERRMGELYNIVKFDTDTDFSDMDFIIIDWFPQSIIDKDKRWHLSYVKQANIVEKYVKKIPMLIFDRYLSITKKEYDYLKKFNVYFFEPALNNRKEFGYLPFWTEQKTLDDFDIDEKERQISLAFKGNLKGKISGFEKYYIDLISHWPNYNVCFDSPLRKEKVDEYKILNVDRKSIDFKDAECTIAIGSAKEYLIGYLDSNIFKFMENGCLPFIPIEHRFFCSAFHTSVIKDISEVKWIMNSERSMKLSIIEEIYKNIKSIYPEFLIEYTIDIIKNIMEK